MSDSGLADHASWIDVAPVWAATFCGGAGGAEVEGAESIGLVSISPRLGLSAKS